jgi:uncharacterized protein involved in outer membrane biogenesis
MRGWVRWLTGIVGTTALLALVLVGALWLLVDRDGLRAVVVETVKARTGWDLAIDAPLAVGFDDGLEVTLRGLRLQPGGGPALRAESLRLRVKPWPLLERRLEVDALRLEGLAGEWDSPQRIDVTAALAYDAGAQVLTMRPLEAAVDGAPVTGQAQWRGGPSPELTMELRAGSIVVGGARFADVVANTVLRAGVLTQSLTGALYGGRGAATLEGRPEDATAPWAVRATLEDVRLHELARDLGRPGRLEGRARVESDLHWQGGTDEAARRSLHGTATLALRDGALLGVDLPYLIQKAGAALDRKPFEAVDAGRTPLSALDASATISGGVLHNDDLRGAAPPFQLSGRGTVDLVAERLDYLLTARLPEAVPELGKRLRALRGIPLPVRVTGPLANPAFALDLQAALQEALPQRLERQLEDRLDGKLGDKLRKLLDR